MEVSWLSRFCFHKTATWPKQKHFSMHFWAAVMKVWRDVTPQTFIYPGNVSEQLFRAGTNIQPERSDHRWTAVSPSVHTWMWWDLTSPLYMQINTYITVKQSFLHKERKNWGCNIRRIYKKAQIVKNLSVCFKKFITFLQTQLLNYKIERFFKGVWAFSPLVTKNAHEWRQDGLNSDWFTHWNVN